MMNFVFCHRWNFFQVVISLLEIGLLIVSLIGSHNVPKRAYSYSEYTVVYFEYLYFAD